MAESSGYPSQKNKAGKGIVKMTICGVVCEEAARGLAGETVLTHRCVKTWPAEGGEPHSDAHRCYCGRFFEWPVTRN